jgi:hypothetical protein
MYAHMTEKKNMYEYSLTSSTPFFLFFFQQQTGREKTLPFCFSEKYRSLEKQHNHAFIFFQSYE